jgi:hypothetical protein
MKNIKLLAIVGIASLLKHNKCASFSRSKHRSALSSYIRSLRARYEPQRRTVEYQRERVIYVDNRDYDEDRRYEDRRYEDRRYIGKTSW